MTETYDILAVLRPADANEATLYTAPALTSVIATLFICNQDSSTRTYNVRLGATDADYLAYGTSLLANIAHKINPIILGPADVVKVTASIANKISFVLVGLKVT